MSITGGAQGIGGAVIIGRIVAVDIVRIIIREFKFPGAILTLIAALILPGRIPGACEVHKAVFVIDTGRRYDGHSIIEIVSAAFDLFLHNVGNDFRRTHLHGCGRVDKVACAVDSNTAVFPLITGLIFAAVQRGCRSQAFRGSAYCS